MIIMLSMSFAGNKAEEQDNWRFETSDREERIYGGEPSQNGAWEHTVALMSGGQPFCTGTLIAPRVVLSAAHCMGEGGPEAVSFGNNAGSGESIEVQSVYVYPNPNQSYDVAVLRLAGDASVAPATIALPCVLDEAFGDGQQVTVVGFGITETDEANTRKNEVVTSVRDHDCSRTNVFYCNARVSPGGEFVAGADGKDSCYGDSGGPVYVGHQGEHYLVGVTSRGATDDADCGHGGVYVRPDAIFGWIEAQSGTTLARPDCDDGSDYPDGPDSEEPGEGGDTGWDTGSWNTGDWDTGDWDTGAKAGLDSGDWSGGGFLGCSSVAPGGSGLALLVGGLLLVGRERRTR